MRKFLTISLMFAMIVSVTIACKRVAKDSEVTSQQEEVMEIDETIATEEEENAVNAGIEIIDDEASNTETEEIADTVEDSGNTAE
jgi:hypothetical protein